MPRRVGCWSAVVTWPWRVGWILLALGALSCSRPAPPNVVLVVVDTLRADRLGAYGDQRGLTPFLDQLASRGTVFANAYAPSSWTIPSVASLFTSRYPTQHNATNFKAVLSEDEVTLAEKLAARDYRTGGVSANFLIAPKAGFTQGFQDWQVLAPASGLKVRGDQVRGAGVSWLDRAIRPQTPSRVLLYLQYMEPHSPYEPPPLHAARFQPADVTAEQVRQANEKMNAVRFAAISPEEGKLLESLYDAEVAAADDELRLMFDELERRGVLENAVVIITADHGEEFREHGVELGHGASLFEPVVRIPLIVLAPGTGGGPPVPDLVSLTDVAPTILDLVGADPERRFEGRSLAPLLTRQSGFRAWFSGSAPAPRDVVLELPPTGSKFDVRRQQAGLVHGREKLLVDRKGGTQLFDLEQDPGEQTPLQSDARGAALYDALTKHQTQLAGRANPEPELQTIDDASKEKLRALGYHF
jgi:arylsulfatase A-like enzyme